MEPDVILLGNSHWSLFHPESECRPFEEPERGLKASFGEKFVLVGAFSPVVLAREAWGRAVKDLEHFTKREKVEGPIGNPAGNRFG